MSEKTFTDEISSWVSLNLDNCIGVDECMKACPVVSDDLTIAELNGATRAGNDLTPAVLKFAEDCVQCGRCDTVCPTGAGRSIMMLALKEKMVNSGKAPERYVKYMGLKGYDKSFAKRSAFNLYMKTKWKFSDKERERKLARFIDKKGLKKSEYLFYFGCYIFTGEESALQTIDLAEQLKCDFDILGGLTTCCGWPSLLAGRMDEAERYHKHLAERIAEADPKYVVTGCAECFMSLRKIKNKYNMAFEPLTTPMWLLQYDEVKNLEPESLDGGVTYHDSCNISRKAGAPEPARELLHRLTDFTEMERSGAKDTYCCGYWNFEKENGQLAKIHKSRYAEAKSAGAQTMVVECVTCLESFGKENKGVDVVDIVGMVHGRLVGNGES